MIKIVKSFLLLSVTVFASNASAFWVEGKIKRVLAEGDAYAGCMIYLDSPHENGCPGSRGSLDCNGLIYSEHIDAGMRRFSAALVAAAGDHLVQLWVVPNKNTTDGHCVARRLDVVY